MALRFSTGKQRWTAADRANNIIDTQYNGVSQSLGVSASGPAQVYFVAPGKSHFLFFLFFMKNRILELYCTYNCFYINFCFSFYCDFNMFFISIISDFLINISY